MRIVRILLLSGVGLATLAPAAMAGGATLQDGVDIDQLAATSAPVLPAGSRLLSISRTPQPEVPGLPLSARDKAALGDTATTLRILPATGAPADGAISWSGYSQAGVIYRGSN